MDEQVFDDPPRNDRPQDIAVALAELQATLLHTESLERFLHELAVLAVRIVEPDRLSCGITLQENGRTLTVASSDETAMCLDEVQYGSRQGPCLQSLDTNRRIRVDDLSAETRWGDYPSRALQQGVRASLSLPLSINGGALGAVNLYAFRPDAFGEAEIARASQLAAQAAGAVGLAVRLAAQGALTEQLNEALASRTAIAQATGIIMARWRCNPDEAFGVLRKQSMDRNVKLRQVADEFVGTYLATPAPEPGRS